jgi:hypothetical protein
MAVPRSMLASVRVAIMNSQKGGNFKRLIADADGTFARMCGPDAERLAKRHS